MPGMVGLMPATTSPLTVALQYPPYSGSDSV